MCTSGAKRVTCLSKKGLFLCWELQESFQVPRTEHLPTNTSLCNVEIRSGNGPVNTLYGQKGSTTKKLLHFSRPRGSSKMPCVIKWCVDTALELLTEMSGQEYLNIHEGTSNFQHSTYSIAVKYGSWTLLGTSFSAQVFYTQNDFFNLCDIIAHINSVSSCTSHFFSQTKLLSKINLYLQTISRQAL